MLTKEKRGTLKNILNELGFIHLIYKWNIDIFDDIMDNLLKKYPDYEN